MSSQLLPVEAKQLFHYLFEQASLGIAVEDLDGKVLLANPALCSILGYRDNELCGMSCSQFADPEDSADDWALFEQLRAGIIDHYSLEKRYIRKDGARVWGRLNVSMLNTGEEGSPPLVFAFVEDVTERKQVEEALKKSEEKFSKAFRESPMALTLTSAIDHRYLDVNETFGQMTGWLRNEVIGRTPSDIGIWVDSTQRLEFVKRVLAKGAVRGWEVHYRSKDGTQKVGLGAGELIQIENEPCILSVIADITDRKRAEEAIRESENRYRRIVETTNEGVWLLDSKLHTCYVNRQTEEMLGYEPGEMTGRSVFDFYFPEDFENKKQGLKRRQQGVREQIEERLRRKDGSELWVRMSVNPLFKDNGEFDGALAMVSDITERKLAEEALLESEERLRLAAQAGKMYAFEWDVATDEMVRSSEYVNVLGASEPRTLTHQQAMEKVHPDDREKLVAAVDRHSLENPTVDVMYRMLLPGKSPIWIKSSGRAFFDGEGRMLRVIGMVADVTDQKLAEEALRSSEERLRLAQKAARIGTFERNIRAGVNTWTPEMESMYGLPPGSFGQTRTAFENLVHPDDRAEVMKLVEEALKTGQPTHGEWRVVWPDQSVHWIAGYWQVLMEESGEPSRVLGVNMDITERKLAEAALTDVSRKLIEAQEQERTRIGRELHDDIGQRLAMVAIELQQLHEDPLVLPEVRGRTGELQKRISEIAADIQSLSHELHSAKLQYLGVAGAMRSFCQEFGEQQKVEVNFQTHELPSPLSPDMSLCLFRVLQEALHNAVKHSRVRHFEVRLWGTSDEIHLTVRDSGAGFDRDAARASRGLGLISMEERLKLVKGTLSIDSQPKRGTTIHARVPMPPVTDSVSAAG